MFEREICCHLYLCIKALGTYMRLFLSSEGKKKTKKKTKQSNAFRNRQTDTHTFQLNFHVN